MGYTLPRFSFASISLTSYPSTEVDTINPGEALQRPRRMGSAGSAGRSPAMPGECAGAVDVAMEEFEAVYAFIYARVGNRADAEDLTQQVALKALPRLRNGWPEPAVRGYLYATARSALASFWSGRRRLPEAELGDNVWFEGRGQELVAPPEAAAWVERTLNALPANYRRVLELRFLRGYSLREAAQEMGKTVGGIKVMQLRALRAAAVLGQTT
jgi:RNA polymerase sigma factor (sigma-70 family)